MYANGTLSAQDGRGEILLEDFCSVLLAAQAQQQLAADAAGAMPIS